MRFSFKPEEFETVKHSIATYKADEEPQNINDAAPSLDGVPAYIDTQCLIRWYYHPNTRGVRVYKTDKSHGIESVYYYPDSDKSKCYIIRSKI